MLPRWGIRRPRQTITAKITANGTASSTPLTFTYLVSSACKIPMPSAPPRVSQKDWKFPITPAAREGNKSAVVNPTETPMIGPSRIPASPASAAPRIQFHAATELADQPSVVSAWRFSRPRWSPSKARPPVDDGEYGGHAYRDGDQGQPAPGELGAGETHVTAGEKPEDRVDVASRILQPDQALSATSIANVTTILVRLLALCSRDIMR